MYTNHVKKDEQKKTPVSPEQTNHEPRLVKPEDESYGELMMRFTAHPVKPKYWFEEFGDHWTCSCGQINKGETCTNCGLERNLLRKLFILHKPSPELGDGEGQEPISDSDNTITMTIPRPASEDSSPPASETAEEPVRTNSRLVVGVIIIATLLLLATGAFLYFVLLPEMQEQDAAKRDSVRISLTENLPVAAAPVPRAQRRSYISAGDMLCKKGKYRKAMNYYNKAADMKDDESIQQKILDAKFGYVKAHQDDGEDYFETYLNELADAHYDGIQAIYNQYYAWHVTIVANNLENDFSTDMKNVNRNDSVGTGRADFAAHGPDVIHRCLHQLARDTLPLQAAVHDRMLYRINSRLGPWKSDLGKHLAIIIDPVDPVWFMYEFHWLLPPLPLSYHIAGCESSGWLFRAKAVCSFVRARAVLSWRPCPFLAPLSFPGAPVLCFY